MSEPQRTTSRLRGRKLAEAPGETLYSVTRGRCGPECRGRLPAGGCPLTPDHLEVEEPSTVQLVYYPNPLLKRRADSVTVIDDALRGRVGEMFHVMYREGGVGLAAPQVGWSTRLFVMNAEGQENPEGERVFINPQILEQSGEEEAEEGCLSIPDVRGRVVRSETVRVRAQDLTGKFFEVDYTGLPARVVLHENDHLDGILFISRLSQTDKLLARKTLRGLEREYRQRLKQQETPARG